MFKLDLGKMGQCFGAEMGEHDPSRSELVPMRHELAVRDVRRVIAIEVRRFADEEVGAVRDRDELLAPARVAGVGDHLSVDLDAQAMGLGQRSEEHTSELQSHSEL